MERCKRKITTLTLSPAIDVHRSTDGVDMRRDIGGKGINLSRDLFALGMKSLCFAIVGEQSLTEILARLAPLGDSFRYVTVSGKTRENVNVQVDGIERVIRGASAAVSPRTVKRIRGELYDEVESGSFLCLCGRIPDGSDKLGILELLRDCRQRGAELCIDSVSLDATDIAGLRPYVIKPNLEEAEALLGVRICTDSAWRAESNVDVERISVAEALSRLLRLGSRYVLMTLGSEGAYLATAESVYFAPAISLSPLSTTGAGDATLSGFLFAKAEEKADREALCYAVAMGAGACLTEGTLPPDPCQVFELLERVTVKKIC